MGLRESCCGGGQRRFSCFPECLGGWDPDKGDGEECVKEDVDAVNEWMC